MVQRLSNKQVVLSWSKEVPDKRQSNLRGHCMPRADVQQ